MREAARKRGGLLDRVSWHLVRAGELAEGRLAVQPRGGTRYALLALWCVVLGGWLAAVRFRRKVLNLIGAGGRT